jgi:hypothetical protein
MEDILAILLIFGGGTLVLLGFSPIGRAIADRIRGKQGQVDTEELRAELTEHRDALTEEVQQVRREIAELAERVDFAERLLAKQRDALRVGPGNP